MMWIHSHTMGVPHPRAWRRNGQGLATSSFSTTSCRSPRDASQLLLGALLGLGPLPRSEPTTCAPQDASLLFPRLPLGWAGSFVAQRDASQHVSG